MLNDSKSDSLSWLVFFRPQVFKYTTLLSDGLMILLRTHNLYKGSLQKKKTEKSDILHIWV